MYKTSTDYKELFSIICAGSIVAAFVDYKHRTPSGHDDSPPCRDICMIRRNSPFDIFIGARGISYGGVYPFMSKDSQEFEAFQSACEQANLEWIC